MQEGMNKRILELLAQKNMTQKQLSERASVTEAAISHYIKGDRVPRSAVAERIANALGTSVDYLLNGSNPYDDDEKEQTFRLIARNASNMTYEEKKRIMDLLFKPED